MSAIILNKVTDIKRYPIRSAVLYYNDGTEHDLYLYYLEKGSSFSSKNISRNHYEGGKLQLGTMLSVNLVIPQNIYPANGLLEFLDIIVARSAMGERAGLALQTGTADITGSHYKPPVINADGSRSAHFLTQCLFTYDIEQKDTRPHIILQGEGFAYKLSNITNTPEEPVSFMN
jgi:hypothetical protein